MYLGSHGWLAAQRRTRTMVLQMDMLTDGARSGSCDQPLNQTPCIHILMFVLRPNAKLDTSTSVTHNRVVILLPLTSQTWGAS